MLGIKIRTVLKLKLMGSTKMSKFLTIGALEAEKLQKPRWPTCCGTPCNLHTLWTLISSVGPITCALPTVVLCWVEVDSVHQVVGIVSGGTVGWACRDIMPVFIVIYNRYREILIHPNKTPYSLAFGCTLTANGNLNSHNLV